MLLCHYYVVARGYLEIDDLYTSRKDGVYHYSHGWNWRAYLAYVIGIIPNFYGFLNNMGVSAPAGVTKAYYFAYPIGLFVSFGVYWLACWISPPALTYSLDKWHEPRDYVRPEERGEVSEGGIGYLESESGSTSAGIDRDEKIGGENGKVVGVSAVKEC